MTIELSKQLAGTPIVVTAVCPGFVQTDLTPASRDVAPLSADEAAKVVVDAALTSSPTPSGTFIDANGVVPW